MAEQSGKGIPVLPEAEAVAARAKLRNALKAEFRKQLTHPYRISEPGYIFDPAIQRFQAMKASNFDFFKVTPRTTYYGLLPVLGIYLSFIWYTTAKRGEFENQLRTGQISYADRQFKFST